MQQNVSPVILPDQHYPVIGRRQTAYEHQRSHHIIISKMVFQFTSLGLEKDIHALVVSRLITLEKCQGIRPIGIDKTLQLHKCYSIVL